MTRVVTRPLAALSLILGLAACQQSGPKQSDAPVEVLSGSISDAMLPLDQVTSQPPLDPKAARVAGSGAAPDAAEATEAAPEPAAPEAAPPGGLVPAEGGPAQ